MLMPNEIAVPGAAGSVQRGGAAPDGSPLVLVCSADYRDIGGLLAHLTLAGMRATCTCDEVTAIQMRAALRPDLILIETHHQIISELEAVEKIRANSGTPVIILSAVSNEAEMLHCLQAGADDYLCRPYHGVEVVARIEAVLRRAQFKGNLPRKGVFRVHPFEVDLTQMKIFICIQDHRVLMERTPNEFKILRQLLMIPGRIHRREELLSCFCGVGGPSRKVDLYISRLRRKLNQSGVVDVLKTIRNVGYLFTPVSVGFGGAAA